VGIFGSSKDDETREQPAAPDDAARQREAERPLQPEEIEQPPARETRAAVTEEPPPRRDGDEDDEYQWHTGRQRPHGQQDAVEFVEVHKAFGRNKILRGLNMGIPED
jgi:phospholipid/cholesterol/gamma-HCH transport system ATP-binding protein